MSDLTMGLVCKKCGEPAVFIGLGMGAFCRACLPAGGYERQGATNVAREQHCTCRKSQLVSGDPLGPKRCPLHGYPPAIGGTND